MLRGIFMAPGVTPDQVGYYTDLFAKIRALPEWKEFLAKGAFNDWRCRASPSSTGWARTSDAPCADEGSRLPGPVTGEPTGQT